jgi:UDP-N-acetylmuramoyl-tripeptide--D-alanyl-D-alanine ligase
MSLLIVLIWFTGTCVRIYKQARFFQIEEYMNLRYLRWWLSEREHWLPLRPVGAWFIGSALGVMLSEGGSILPSVISVIAAIIGVWPPDEGEIKKSFTATSRAKRLLAASFLITFIAVLSTYLIINSLSASRFQSLPALVSGLAGVVLFLLAPLELVSGNLLMLPVEALLRRRYMQQARSILAQIQPKVIGITGSYGKTTTKTYWRKSSTDATRRMQRQKAITR